MLTKEQAAAFKNQLPLPITPRDPIDSWSWAQRTNEVVAGFEKLIDVLTDPEPEPPKGNPVTVDLFGPRLQQLLDSLDSLDITVYPAQERIIWNLLQAERKAPTMAASSIWTEVTDLTTLKEGDRIKVTHDTTLLEITLGAPVEGPDKEGDYLINLAGLTCSDVFVPAEGSKFFIKEPEFAPLTRALEPGEVVEDRTGNQYAVNPFDSSRLIDQYAGYNNHRTPALNYLHNTDVRPVR